MSTDRPTAIIRRATAEDAEAMREVDTACFGHTWTRHQYISIAADGLSCLLVARVDGQTVGNGWLQVQGEQGYIPTLGVLEAYRGRGIGGALLDGLVAAARERRLAQVVLEVRSQNAPARALYVGRGFVAIGVRRGLYLNPPDDAVVMAKQLPRD